MRPEEQAMIHVLDHGYVRLVDRMGDDMAIVRSARVSYGAEPRGDDKDRKLIRYLWRNAHTSPFEAVSFTFEVQAPIFVLRQWHRHRTWCIAGSAPLVFSRPSDGRAYPRRIDDIVRAFNDPAQTARVKGMRLRAPGGAVNIMDAWHSGEKKVYRITTRYGEAALSEDHVLKTATGPARLKDGARDVMVLARVGDRRSAGSTRSLAPEEWREFEEGYEVSSRGRVRSYWGQGARRKRANPVMKRQTLNAQGRPVVSVRGRGAVQVSRLVADAFIGGAGYVLHRDDDPTNNHVENLYYGSAKDNARDSYENVGRVRLREVSTPIEKVEAVGARDTFDLTVSGDHWFCAGGLVVHNSYNEVSARYTELPELYYSPSIGQITTQSKSNKQMRTEEIHPEAKDIRIWIDACNEAAFVAYRGLLEKGCPRELARSVLPLGTYSRMFATVDLHNLLHFIRLRSHEHAQHEIRVYSDAMLALIKPHVPWAVEAFRDYTLRKGEEA